MLSKVLNLDKLSCPEGQRKRESGQQASEAQREKGRQGFRTRDEKQKRHFLLEEQHENFV